MFYTDDCRDILSFSLSVLYSYVYWTVHHLDSWIKRDQLEVTCFFIPLFNAQHVSDVNTSILRSLRLICWVISWVVLLWFDVCWCYVEVWLGWCGTRMQAEALVLCTGGWVGPRAGLDRCGKSRPHRDLIPDRPARSHSLYRLSYPAHNC